MNKKFSFKNFKKRQTMCDFFKTNIIILFLMMFVGNSMKAQGVDAVFFLDNSSSINNTEWTDMSNSTKALIDEVLECNINNRIAVAHFAGSYTTPPVSTDPKIFLESNFTNNAVSAKSFVRRGGSPTQGGTHYATLGDQTWLHENIALLQNSLGSSTASLQILSPLKKLSRNPNNKLVIFIFTDAPATANGLTKASFSPGSITSKFDNYNIIKTSLGATIVIIQAPTGNGATADASSRAAAAAIASVGGSYNGTVQANAGDPAGSGTKPRKAVMSNVFDISNLNIQTIADNICRSCAPTVEIDAITPPTQDVCKNGTAQALVSNAVGTGTLSYQWYSNTTNSTTGGTLISGATSDTYAPPTSVLGTTYYFVEVADTFCEGKTKSAVVSVTVTTCCDAGTNAPALSSTTISPAPATVADLIAALAATNQPAGTVFTIHSGASATDANKLATSTAVIAGNTYYVAFWDSSNNCYSPTTTVTISDTFGCDNTMYFSAGSSTQLNAIVPAAGQLDLNPVGAAAGFPYNAMAIDPLTGIMYAMRGNTNMYQINGDGTAVNLGTVSGLSTTPPQYVSGEIDPLGNYYVAQTGTIGTIYKINTTTKAATAIGLSGDIAISDMAYNVNDDLLYAVENNTGQLISINPVSGDITSIGVSPGNGVFGAMWGSNTGSVYAQESSGNLYQYDPATGKRVLIATGSSASGSDGAHCVTSPITFEADLSVTKTDGTANYIPGFSTTYTIVVENNGPFGVLNAHVSDPVPAGIPAINVSYTAVASSGSTTEVSGTQTGAINDLVSLPVGGTVTYTVTVNIPSNFSGDLVNTVTITPPNSAVDINMANNTATDTDKMSYCTKPGDFTSVGVPTKVGITVQDKATTWPEAVPNGHIALESREKGLVITRVAHVSTTPDLINDSVKDPKEGMLVYDIQDSCVKLFNGNTWNCLQRSCNDTN